MFEFLYCSLYKIMSFVPFFFFPHRPSNELLGKKSVHYSSSFQFSLSTATLPLINTHSWRWGKPARCCHCWFDWTHGTWKGLDRGGSRWWWWAWCLRQWAGFSDRPWAQSCRWSRRKRAATQRRQSSAWPKKCWTLTDWFAPRGRSHLQQTLWE